jgi:hypothetical protein
MQEEMFALERSTPETSPLHGVKLKLERKVDLTSPCCSNFAIIHAGKGPHAAELRCERCGKHRGWLPKEWENFLLTAIAFFPDARNEIHTVRDSKQK